MLVLSRKANQSIQIHRDGQHVATVTISDLAGNRVRIGVDAPKDVRIVRSEIADEQWPLSDSGLGGTNPGGKHDAA